MKSSAIVKMVSSYVLLYALVILIAVLISSCSPSRKVSRVMARHPAEAAEVCGRMYPPKTSTKTVTEYLPGKTVYTPGKTVYVDCDSAIAAAEKAVAAGKNRPQTSAVPADCPPQEHRVDTVKAHDTTVVENTAALYALQEQNVQQADTISRQAIKLTWLWWIAGVSVGWHIARFIFKRYFPWLKI